MNTSQTTMMYGWKDIPWQKIERKTFKLQKRIYQASSRGDIKKVRKLQRLLLKSRSARLLAVRKVTQDNQGRKTAGIDGVKSLSPPQRLQLSETLEINKKANPLRRVWIPKPGTNEHRGLAIPTMYDRALQSLVKSALEPEWEARFEANSYGFRPGRSAHDAVEAIFLAISRKPKYVLDADIAKCFDKIDHQALLKKVNTSPSVSRQIKAWLKAGVCDGRKLFPTEVGVPQGGTISPLLMNIALHGLETKIIEKFPGKGSISPPKVVRYADDLVVLHQDQSVIKQCQETISAWLKEMGLELKPSKTRIVHTLEKRSAGVGFDFLGFNIRQYRVGKTKGRKTRKRLGYKTIINPSKEAIAKHVEKLKETVNNHKGSEQEELINHLNPIIVGWANYYSTVVSKAIFGRTQTLLTIMLLAWGKSRHSKKGERWVVGKYWRVDEGKGWIFQPRASQRRLIRHNETPIRRHVKVKGNRSPFDGDWVYWSTRLGRHPGVSPRVARLLKKQGGRCQECRAFFKDGDVMEVDHIIPKEQGGIDVFFNLQVLHRHCHDRKTSREKEDERYQ